MPSASAVEAEITDYFKRAGQHASPEQAVVASLMGELTTLQKPVSKTAIIMGLIEKLESESDPARLDVYRQALEMVIHSPVDGPLAP
ncbi:biofilm development regulator YmgB/AriR family protein [Pantoea sp. 1.19]|uniref:biofilm development regulator YmgB/AriR family protein n=1 Tax=Pantoea sp. 1.19 TaxID=1925589 RepID=UPI000948AB59|nr:biofilm development regulator YmgB/AriR family protein [Pantoea sp. 1.19]